MSTSKLQKQVGRELSRNFPDLHIVENCRPSWLVSSNATKLELDFYIENLSVAIEVQGAQHFIFTSFFFRDNDEFELRLRYDREKKDLCYGKRIKLIEICSESEIPELIDEIKNLLPKSKTIEMCRSKLQMDALHAIEKGHKQMADGLSRKVLKRHYRGIEIEIHPTIKKYLGIID